MISLRKSFQSVLRYAIITMSVLYVFFLNILFVSHVRSDLLPGVVCVRLGTHTSVQHGTKVEISDIPHRCKVVIIGNDYFNAAPSSDDNAAILALKAADKIVYMMYELPFNTDWDPIISDPTKLDTFIEPMLKYLEENNIDGVILAYLNTDNGQIPNYASKINTLISKIRHRVPSITIGLHLDGSQSSSFNNNQIFDFTLTNTTIDYYVVDLWSVGPDCKAHLNESGGRQPITSDDSDVLTLEKVSDYITNSSLEKTKLVVSINDLPTLIYPKGGIAPSYSDYCKRNGLEGVWCGDTSQILYDRVNFLKKIFHGLMIQYLDLDDTTNTCGCEKFPVANMFFDAWEGKPLKSCPALN